MPIGLYVEALYFPHGLEVKLRKSSIVVIVGPNNSGKSTLLREIALIARKGSHKGVVLSDAIFKREGSIAELKEKIEPYKSKSAEGVYYFEGESTSYMFNMQDQWEGDRTRLDEMTSVFVKLLNASKRMEDCDPVDNVDVLRSRMTSHPIQDLYLSDELEDTVSKRFRLAFQQDLFVHRGGGKTLHLYTGIKPKLEEGESPFSRSYFDKIEQQSPLSTQGDGLRSFTSLILRLWTRSPSVLLIDEPEAFLHPPQARMIGELLAESPGTSQLFIATHSNDVVQGLLAAYPERVSVLRLQRAEIGATFLRSDKVAALWKDPILKYSNVLDGLFHNSVIVTESDGDCRFYEAVSQTSTLDGVNNDILFTFSSGKDRIATIVGALKALSVTVASIVDVDVLNSTHPLKAIIESHGGDWKQFEKDATSVKSKIEEQKIWLSGQEFKTAIEIELAKVKNDGIVSKECMTAISKLLNRATPWKAVKAAGAAAIPPGDPTVIYNRLCRNLECIGIFVVPNGEMEGFCRSIGGHGPRWVDAALQRDVFRDPEFDEARKFLRSIKQYLISSQGDTEDRFRFLEKGRPSQTYTDVDPNDDSITTISDSDISISDSSIKLSILGVLKKCFGRSRK